MIAAAVQPMQQPDISLLTQRVKALASAPNLAASMKDEDLSKLANAVLEGFEIDKESMGDWQERMQRGLDLAMLVKNDKTYPWVNASNIRYPLITSAALQYNARAYPAIVPSTDVVKVSVQGAENGQKAARARRVASYMSWQLKVDSREWERGTDQMTLQLPIVGDLFRKVRWDVTTNRVRSQIRLPGKHIVINNNATTIADAPRISDQIDLYPHQVRTNILSGRFLDIEIPPKPEDDHSPEAFIEQLCRHDLDGDDYPEPYIVTVHKETQKVVRVVAAYDTDTVRIDGQGRIVAAEAVPYLIHYQFMPAMDGGLLGTGMGLLLGDISETINSTLNMIMDSGALSSLGGGFIGAQNFRIKGGVQTIRPGEYRQVNFSGQDIRQAIVDLQFPGPSPVLFQMLGLLIESGREITSVSNVMTGDAGRQNMPVGTVMALIEQGQMVFTASYKRIYLALQDEFALICRLNSKNLPPERYNAFLDGEQPSDPAADFNLADMDVLPVADPNSVTSMQKMGRAQFLLELATQGLVNPQEVAMRVLDAASIENPEALIPQPDPQMLKQQQLMQRVQEEMIVLDIQLKQADLDQREADTLATIAKAERDAAEVDLMPLRARIEQLRAMKEALGARRTEIEGGRTGGMAGASGDGMAAVGSAQGGRVQ